MRSEHDEKSNPIRKTRKWWIGSISLVAILIIGIYFYNDHSPSLSRRSVAPSPILPAPRLIQSQLKYEKEDLQAGQSLQVSIQMHAYQTVKVVGSPELHIYKNGESQNIPLVVMKIPDWNGLSLQNGGEVSHPVTLTAPSEPGYYRIDFLVSVAHDEGNVTRTGTMGHMILVDYPKGETLEGTVAVNKKIQVNEHTLKVVSVSMTSKYTDVNFNFLPASNEHGLPIHLMDQNGKTIQLLKTTPLEGSGNSTWRFEPLPITTKSLTFEIEYLDHLTMNGVEHEHGGPWKVEFNLPSMSTKS